ncbi:hypothetical protein HDU99_002967, partial [Rhizoclosmatium hyalinum]
MTVVHIALLALGLLSQIALADLHIREVDGVKYFKLPGAKFTAGQTKPCIALALTNLVNGSPDVKFDSYVRTSKDVTIVGLKYTNADGNQGAAAPKTLSECENLCRTTDACIAAVFETSTTNCQMKKVLDRTKLSVDLNAKILIQKEKGVAYTTTDATTLVTSTLISTLSTGSTVASTIASTLSNVSGVASTVSTAKISESTASTAASTVSAAIVLTVASPATTETVAKSSIKSPVSTGSSLPVSSLVSVSAIDQAPTNTTAIISAKSTGVSVSTSTTTAETKKATTTTASSAASSSSSTLPCNPLKPTDANTNPCPAITKPSEAIEKLLASVKQPANNTLPKYTGDAGVVIAKMNFKIPSALGNVDVTKINSIFTIVETVTPGKPATIAGAEMPAVNNTAAPGLNAVALLITPNGYAASSFSTPSVYIPGVANAAIAGDGFSITYLLPNTISSIWYTFDLDDNGSLTIVSVTGRTPIASVIFAGKTTSRKRAGNAPSFTIVTAVAPVDLPAPV